MANAKIKFSKWTRRLFGLLAILIILGSVSIILARTLCGDSIPDTTLDENITTFLGDTQFTTHDLILAAENYVGDRIWFVARAGNSIWTSATYQCNDRDCQLQRLRHEVGTKRYVACAPRMPGNEKVTQFRFDITNDHIEAETYSHEGGSWLHPQQLKEVSPTIDEALIMAFDNIDPDFLEQHTVTIATIAANLDHWQVSVHDLNDAEEISIEIPFESDSSSG